MTVQKPRGLKEGQVYFFSDFVRDPSETETLLLGRWAGGGWSPSRIVCEHLGSLDAQIFYARVSPLPGACFGFCPSTTKMINKLIIKLWLLEISCVVLGQKKLIVNPGPSLGNTTQKGLITWNDPCISLYIALLSGISNGDQLLCISEQLSVWPHIYNKIV